MSALDFAILLLYSFLRWWHSCIHWCAVTLVQAIKHLQNTLIHPSLVLNAEKMKLLMFSFAGKWPINIQEAAERASGWNWVFNCFSFNVKCRMLDYGSVSCMHKSAWSLNMLDTTYRASLRFITNCEALTHRGARFSSVPRATRRLPHRWTFI